MDVAGLRPAHAGVVLAGVGKPPHVAATYIDLGIRGYLLISEAGEGERSRLASHPAVQRLPALDDEPYGPSGGSDGEYMGPRFLGYWHPPAQDRDGAAGQRVRGPDQ